MGRHRHAHSVTGRALGGECDVIVTRATGRTMSRDVTAVDGFGRLKTQLTSGKKATMHVDVMRRHWSVTVGSLCIC